MTALPRGAGPTSPTGVHLTSRHLTVALVAVLLAAVLALSIALASTGGGSGGESDAIRVAPSAPIPPSAAERDQPQGLNGPGMRP